MSTVLDILDKDGHFERKPTTKGDRIDHTPIVIGDAADNPGGGAPGSGTHLLRALMETNGLGCERHDHLRAQGGLERRGLLLLLHHDAHD